MMIANESNWYVFEDWTGNVQMMKVLVCQSGCQRLQRMENTTLVIMGFVSSVVPSKPHEERCSGKYEGVKRNYSGVCVEEAKYRYPNPSVRRLRKLVSPGITSSTSMKMSPRHGGCRSCNLAVCKKDHWSNFNHQV